MSNNIQHDSILCGGFSTIRTFSCRNIKKRFKTEEAPLLFQSKEQIFYKQKQFVWSVLIKSWIQSVLNLTSPETLKDSHCNCIAGITTNCKHSAALFLYICNERSTSQTDKESNWKLHKKFRCYIQKAHWTVIRWRRWHKISNLCWEEVKWKFVKVSW